MLWVAEALFNTLETRFGPGKFSLDKVPDADFPMVCL